MDDVAAPRSIANLAAALTKAQSAFPSVPRDKTVTVQTKNGGSYTFKYAPLDTILAAVREPLATNGLALSQLLDGTSLVTMLIHESGEWLEGRTPLGRDPDDTVQAYGSAITYLRRYAIQALLGIAAEEDDDGNRASGNRVRTDQPREHPGLVDGDPHRPPLDRPPLVRETGTHGLIGKLVASGNQDMNIRETPDGSKVLPFRIKEGNRAGQIVLAHGADAEALFAIRDVVIGQTVTVWGRYEDLESPKPDGFVVTYKVLHMTRITTPDVAIPANEASSEPLWPDESEQAAILEAEMAEATA